MSTVPRYPIQPHTVDDYQQWEGDWELIQGIAVAMGPSPFGPHERMVDDIADGIKLQLRRQKCDCRIYRNLDWIISPHDVVRPDLMLVCGVQPERHLERVQEMCVEVLSASTRQHDLFVKRPLYRDCRVPYYLIAEPGQESFQLFINADGQEREALELTADDRRTIVLSDGCELTIGPALLQADDYS